jgi:hypothetical protein
MKVLCLLLLCSVASAQTYDYQGVAMTGTDTVSLYTTPGNLTSVATPVSEAFSAQVVLSGPTLAYTLSLGGQQFLTGSGASVGDGTWILGPGAIQATYANGAINGFDIGINNCCGKINEIINVGPTGDSYYDSYDLGNAGFSITGLASSTAGVWVGPIQAPEIDPASAASGLALLLGTLMVARGRRPLRPPPHPHERVD